MALLIGCFEAHQQHTTKVSFSPLTSVAPILLKTLAREGSLELQKWQGAIKPSRLQTCCAVFSTQSKMVEGDGSVGFHVKMKLSNADPALK